MIYGIHKSQAKRLTGDRKKNEWILFECSNIKTYFISWTITTFEDPCNQNKPMDSLEDPNKSYECNVSGRYGK